MYAKEKRSHAHALVCLPSGSPIGFPFFPSSIIIAIFLSSSSPLSHGSNHPLNPLFLASTTNSQRSLCDHRRPSLLGRTNRPSLQPHLIQYPGAAAYGGPRF